jgi:hypothetical protein
MAKYDPRFQLKEPNSKKRTNIRLRLGFDYIDFTWYVKDSFGRILKIYPCLWDRKKQQPIPKGKIPSKYRAETFDLQIIQSTIDEVKLTVNQIINESLIKQTTITKKYLTQEIEIRLGLQKREKGITIYEFCLQIIQEMEEGIIKTLEGTDYGSGTIRGYRTFAKYFKFFKPESQFSDISDVWYKDFIAFCINKQEVTSKDGSVFTKEESELDHAGNYIKKISRI